MSTKTLREVVERFAALPVGSDADDGEVVAMARAEVEAIRKAAVVVVDASSDLISSDRHDEYRAGMETLRAIAKETE